MMDFGNELNRCRGAAELSMQRLADASGLDKSFISRLEKEQRHPTRETIAALVAGLAYGESDDDRQAIVRLWLAAGFVPPLHRVTGLEFIGARAEAA